jgi:helicase
MEELVSFYKKTFYAHQFEDMYEVEQTIKEVVETLRDYEFLKKQELEATKVGHRVSELYIDPDSAHHMLECLEKAEERMKDGRGGKRKRKRGGGRRDVRL